MIQGMWAASAIEKISAAGPIPPASETNFKQDKGNLIIKEIIVNEGPTYKRRVTISKGRAHPLLKRTSHISLKLVAKTEEQKEAKVESQSTVKKDIKYTKATPKKIAEKAKAETKKTN